MAAIVLDPGSQSTRIGYAGEEQPRIITPSYARLDKVAEDQMDVDDDNESSTSRPRIKRRTNIKFPETAVNYPKPHSELKSIVKDGMVQDWDSAVEQWEYLFDSLKVNYDEQPLLLTEPVWNTSENRKKSLEVALEQFQFPGFYLASNPTCVAFAQGRPSALVVDVGHDIASVTPVVDGMCLTKTALKTHYAGSFVSQQLHNKLNAINEEIIPRYRVLSKVLTKPEESPNWKPKQFENITKSFDDYQLEVTLHQIKESILKVPNEPIFSNTIDQSEIDTVYPKRSFELPNGHTFEFGKERFEAGDALFDPEHYSLDSFEAESGEPEIESKNDYVPLKRAKKPTEDEDDETSVAQTVKTTSKRSKKDTVQYRGLGALTSHALSLVDVDIRAQLAHNIIVTGSSSLIPGLTERLYLELTKLHPGLKIRLHASGNSTERKYQSWIGGSVLSSLGTFHQLWVSKKELEEVGVDKLLNQRFR